MSEANPLPPTPPVGGTGPAPAPEAPAEPAAPAGASADGSHPDAAARHRRALARQYAARRLAWIGEHSRDDNFLIFVGVAALLALAGLVAFGYYRGKHKERTFPPVPLPLLFSGKAEEVAPGKVRVEYDFACDEAQPTAREACPQIADWKNFVLDEKVYKFKVLPPGVMACGGAGLRPFFQPGELSVECDVALITGSHISLVLGSVYKYCEGDGYRLSLAAERQGSWPATAQIIRHQDGARSGSSPVATLGELRAQRSPPLFYRVKLEMAGGKVRAWFGRNREELREVCSLDAPDDLGAGTVVLTGEDSVTAYDNVVVTGRPHPEFVADRTKLYHLLDAPGGVPPTRVPPAKPEAESGPPR